MENLSILFYNVIGLIMVFAGFGFFCYGLAGSLSDTFPKGLKGVLLSLSLFFIGGYFMYNAPTDKMFEFQTNENEYVVQTVLHSLEISIREKKEVAIIQNGEIKYDSRLKKIAIIKCDYLKTYKDCLEQFKQNESKVLTSYMSSKEPIVITLK